MSRRIRVLIPKQSIEAVRSIARSSFFFLGVLLLPIAAHAQSGSPFDTGFSNMQTLFTGTIAKAASLIAIVIGGYQFAHGEPGAKKQCLALCIRVHGYADHRDRLHSSRRRR
jgi:type IV secretory pathway VirB2 component (pilin)